MAYVHCTYICVTCPRSDVQERFAPVIHKFSAVVNGAMRMVETARLLGIPVIVTEQYPKGLGHTVSDLTAALGGYEKCQKVHSLGINPPRQS